MRAFKSYGAGRLIIALDVSSVSLARDLIDCINLPGVTYKIGLELLITGGIDLAKHLVDKGVSVFIDAKFLDIDNTVERATARVASIGASFLTIHAQDRKTLSAAVRGKGQSPLQLLGVTVLTSATSKDLIDQSINRSTSELVLYRTDLAMTAGCNGVVASPLEIAQLRAHFGQAPVIVTPGIRLAGSETISNDDQSRTATPRAAILAGADYIVVGRPILTSRDPAATALRIVREIEDAERAFGLVS